jgi:hypothetical protein
MAPATKKAAMTSIISLPLGRRQSPFRKTALVSETCISAASSGVNSKKLNGPGDQKSNRDPQCKPAFRQATVAASKNGFDSLSTKNMP